MQIWSKCRPWDEVNVGDEETRARSANGVSSSWSEHRVFGEGDADLDSVKVLNLGVAGWHKQRGICRWPTPA